MFKNQVKERGVGLSMADLRQRLANCRYLRTIWKAHENRLQAAPLGVLVWGEA